MLDSRVLPHKVTSQSRPGTENQNSKKQEKKSAALFHVHAGVETKPGCQACPLPTSDHVQTDSNNNRPDGI